MTRPAKNVAASVRQRLLNLAKATSSDYNQLLIRYAIERLLYRLSASSHRPNFLLKGAMLFAVWEGSAHRPTQDVDLLGFGDPSPQRLVTVFRELCAAAVEDDGLDFDPESVGAEEIRTTDEYGGTRVTLTATLGGAVLRVQVDVGFGDAVTPAAADSDYPTLLAGLPPPHLRVYPKETVVAEKVEAIAKLGMINTRFKDYYDLLHLSRTFGFDGEILATALQATFSRRGTALPQDLPVGLTATFATDGVKQTQWAAFRRRIGDTSTPAALADAVAALAAFLSVPLREAATAGTSLSTRWTPPGPWVATDSNAAEPK